MIIHRGRHTMKNLAIRKVISREMFNQKMEIANEKCYNIH
jgi:hypothetical protein